MDNKPEKVIDKDIPEEMKEWIMGGEDVPPEMMEPTSTGDEDKLEVVKIVGSKPSNEAKPDEPLDVVDSRDAE